MPCVNFKSERVITSVSKIDGVYKHFKLIFEPSTITEHAQCVEFNRLCKAITYRKQENNLNEDNIFSMKSNFLFIFYLQGPIQFFKIKITQPKCYKSNFRFYNKNILLTTTLKKYNKIKFGGGCLFFYKTPFDNHARSYATVM